MYNRQKESKTGSKLTKLHTLLNRRTTHTQATVYKRLSLSNSSCFIFLLKTAADGWHQPLSLSSHHLTGCHSRLTGMKQPPSDLPWAPATFVTLNSNSNSTPDLDSSHPFEDVSIRGPPTLGSSPEKKTNSDNTPGARFQGVGAAARNDIGFGVFFSFPGVSTSTNFSNIYEAINGCLGGCKYVPNLKNVYRPGWAISLGYDNVMWGIMKSWLSASVKSWVNN